MFGICIQTLIIQVLLLYNPNRPKENIVQKWEYLRLDVSHSADTARITPNFDLTRTVSIKPSELITSLDRLGDQYWEMISVFRSGDQEIYYFKRPVE
jgi:hypothetical protein